jgi:hypothetical protein
VLCPKGPDTKGCSVGKDCTSGACSVAGVCAPPCADGKKDGAETDVDCGGGTCGACGDGKACNTLSDCGPLLTCEGNVCTAAAIDANLLAHWKFDDGAGTMPADSGPNGLAGKFQTGTLAYAAGKFGGAVQFDGSGGVVVDFPNNAKKQGTGVFIPQGDVTYSMWIKTSNPTLQGLQVVEGAKWTGGCDRVIGQGASGVPSFNTWSEVNITASVALNDGNWHHVVYVEQKGQGFFAFIDGQINASAVGSGANTNCGIGCSGFDWADQYWIGTGGNCRYGAQGFKGLIDDVRIYSVPLDIPAVKKLYDAGNK